MTFKLVVASGFALVASACVSAPPHQPQSHDMAHCPHHGGAGHEHGDASTKPKCPMMDHQSAPDAEHKPHG